MKSLIASKTFWVNLLMLIALVFGSAEFRAVLPADNAQAAAVVAGVLAVANIALRLLTSSSIGGIFPPKP
jgi:hypothetical protein